MQNVLLAVNAYCMAGVMSSLVSGNNIKMVSKQINNLAFAFVTPLGADNYYVCHGKRFRASDIEIRKQPITRFA